MRYIPFGVRGWTDISDAARTRVVGYLGVLFGLVSETAFDDAEPREEQEHG